MKRLFFSLCLAALAAYAGYGQATLPGQIAPLKPVEAARFGSAIAADQNQVVVTSPFSQVAYLFSMENGAWVEKAQLPGINKLCDYDGAKGFGASVGMSGNLVAVGAPEATTSGVFAHGQIVVFRNDGKKWRPDQLIRPGQIDMGTNFGQKLLLRENLLVTGAPGYDDRIGRGYIFELQNGKWVETAIVSPQLQMGARFGNDIAIAGNLVAISSPGYKVNNDPLGAVFLYEPAPEGGWRPSQGIHSPDKNLYFGKSVAMSENFLAVGGREKVYVYERSGTNWTHTYTISNPEPNFSMDFARHLAISPDESVLSIGGDGTAYVFQRTNAGWKLLKAFQEPASNGFGANNAFFQGHLLLSAPWERIQGKPCGAVKVEKLTLFVESPDFK